MIKFIYLQKYTTLEGYNILRIWKSAWVLQDVFKLHSPTVILLFIHTEDSQEDLKFFTYC